MVTDVTRSRGGFHRKVQLSLFIRNQLDSGDSTAFAIYSAYKLASQVPSKEFERIARRRIKNAVIRARRTRPRERVKISAADLDVLYDAWYPYYVSGTSGETIMGDQLSFHKHNPTMTRVCSYNSFEHYIYVLRQLGLVEALDDTATASGKSGSASGEWHEAHPSVMLRAIPGRLGDPAWQNIWDAYLGR
jgi:hypothetical protein